MVRMTDIHCHILPDVDDGAQNAEESFLMAQLAADSGAQALIATPHFLLPGDPCPLTAAEIVREIGLLNDQVKSAGVRIYPGMEVFGVDDLGDWIRERRVLTLNGSRYLLVEFFMDDRPYRVDSVIESILECGLTPVIAHPERYQFLQQDPQLARRWVRLGCKLQVNKGSVLGAFGRRAQNTAAGLMEEGLVFAVASDAHSPFRRTTDLYALYETLCDRYSPAQADKWLCDNPMKIIQNR